jgi:hypothetical protein
MANCIPLASAIQPTSVVLVLHPAALHWNGLHRCAVEGASEINAIKS